MDRLPKFAKELLRFSATHPQFILFGNVYDVLPLPLSEEDRYIPYPLTKYLGELLTIYSNYELVVEYVPLEGFQFVSGKVEIYKEITKRGLPDRVITIMDAYETIKHIVTNKEQKCSVLINFGSRMTDISCSRDYPDFMYHMFRLSLQQNPTGNPPTFNPVLFIVDKDNDIPAWYVLENPRVRIISIPKPDFEIRRYIAKAILPRVKGWSELDEDKKEGVLKTFVDMTSGMYSREMLSIVQLAIREELSASEIGESIRRYKVGVPDNPWAKIDKDKLLRAEEYLRRRVMGQEQAIRKAADILRRAYMNLSGAQYSRYSTRPKGILFFAGPTGVGKTEMAKALAELIFGSEHNYIRFDMSEFSQEHTNQRLIGAPPGYVGYETGGELTNAVKQNPFSVILFDEIEKAHPRILDIFLQILDDGRLTSAKGETVYFSESVIIFTSNLGVVQNVRPDMSYEEINEKLTEEIHNFFKYSIGRPEILNRIGENIVVFDFIRPETARLIMRKMLNNIMFKLEEEKGVSLRISDKVEEKLYQEIVKDLGMGGRGIGNKLEVLFVNPLSRLLFELFPKEGSIVYIEDIYNDGVEGWRLKGSL
jgi:ATP-dependent Clp protease ATP-binding subunit ClpA